MTPPRDCPPPGICVPMEFVRARDADTIECRLAGSAFVWAFRLIDVWAPELDGGSDQTRALAQRAKRWVAITCASQELLHVFVPFTGAEQPLKRLTFDRVPAFVYLPGHALTLNETIVAQGFASSRKGGQLGE